MSTIDAATFDELRSTAGAEFVAELVDTFVEEAPLMIDALRAAKAAGDAVAFRRTAHSLKSNSVTFGATELGALARDMELQGMEVAGTPEHIDQLARAFAEAATALKGLANE